MAKQYRALSNIEHGEELEDGSGNQITRFPYGSIVEGLDKDTMKNLWDAGVLEEVGDVPAPVVTKTVTSTPNDPTKGEGAGDPPKDAGSGVVSPAAPGSTGGSPKP